MAASLKKFMQELSGKKAPGPSTTFTIFHLFYALELLSKQPLGRNKLAEKLNVGDGAVRTIISRLRDADLIETAKTGCGLTPKGQAVWRQFEAVFPAQTDIVKTELNPNDCNYAFLVKNVGEKVGTGINQRDAAIIAGARKALVMVYKNGHLRIESVCDNLEEQFPKAAAQILEKMKPQENDAIVVATAETPLKAKRGAFAASWSLISV